MRPAISAMAWLAQSAALRWASRWHRRVTFAAAASLMDDEPLRWEDVSPLRASADQIDTAISEISPSSLWGDGPPPPPPPPSAAIGRMTQELVDTQPLAVIIPIVRQK